MQGVHNYCRVMTNSGSRENRKMSQKKPSKTEIAYEKIFQQIITTEFRPGQQLEEKYLMNTLGMGRTPVREALMRLENNMMVEAQSGKGFTVKPVTLYSTKAVFETLSILEKGVADLAMDKNIDEQLKKMERANHQLEIAAEAHDTVALVRENYKFHMAFAECSHNEYLVYGINAVQCESRRLAYLSFANVIKHQKSLAEHYKTVFKEHLEMIDCLVSHDTDQLKKIIDQHVGTFKGRIVNYLLG